MKALAAIVWLCCALAPRAACAAEVIAHPSVELSADEIRNVYLGEKEFAGRLRLKPVDHGILQETFLARVLQTDLPKYAARWTRKSFRDGVPAPLVKGSDAEVIAFVRATPGAIGYVTKALPGVKVLDSF